MDKEAVASLLGMESLPSKLTDELVATALDDMMARLHGALLVSIPFAGQLTGNTPNGIRAAIRLAGKPIAVILNEPLLTCIAKQVDTP